MTSPGSRRGRRCGDPKNLRQPNGAKRVQQAGALREGRLAARASRGVLQDRLDRVRRQVGIRLEHQRDRAGDDRRRHARAAQAQVRLVRRLPVPSSRYAE